jgi:hypothetical protein
LHRNYVEAMQILQIIPHPVTTSITDNWLVYEFSLPPNDHLAVINFDLKPQHIGMIEGVFTYGRNAELVSFSQFIYP